MTDMIRKKGQYDSFVCCLAMLTGKSYFETVANMPYLGERSLSSAMLKDMFENIGLIEEVHYRVIPHSLKEEVKSSVKKMIWGRRAVIRSRISGTNDQYEFLYWNGAKLYDPKEYSGHEWWEFKMSTVWIFKERPE